jgi:microcystin-dependent protein
MHPIRPVLSARMQWRSALAGVAITLSAVSVQAADTAPSGFDQPFDNVQPSLALHQQLPAIGPNYPGRESGAADSKALGIVRTYANFRAPFGEQLADGSLKAIADNSALFSLVGTQFGGDGRSTFALPDLRGRVIVDAADGFIGDITGSRATTLTVAQLPSHLHEVPGGLFTERTGGGQPVDNRQASLGLRYLIAIDSFYPAQGGGGAATPTFIGQVVASTTNFAPAGFRFADGQLLSIAEHSALFSVIGTTYGGDGQETFALPDLRGRTIIGAGQGAGLTRDSWARRWAQTRSRLRNRRCPACACPGRRHRIVSDRVATTAWATCSHRWRSPTSSRRSAPIRRSTVAWASSSRSWARSRRSQAATRRTAGCSPTVGC